MTRLLLIALSASLLTACAGFNKLTTEQSLQQKAAGTLGVNPDNVVISDKRADSEHVYFIASVRDKTYHCSYKSTMTVQSQTTCE